MSIYEENLKFLKTNFTMLHEKTFEEPLYPVVIEKSEFGPKVRRNNVNCYLNSIYDIKREQNEIFKELSLETRQVILYGIGTGEAISYLQKNHLSLVRIVIVEPSVELFKQFLEVFSLQKQLGHGNVTFLVNDEIDFLVHNLSILTSRIKETQIFVPLSYRALFSDHYELMTSKLLTSLRNLRANTNMGFSITYLWVYNSLKNLKQLAVPVETYRNCFKGLPVVLVGAGPSLNQELDWLRSAKEKAIIVALGSGMRVLDKNGIIPHFRMAYDGHQLELAVFNDIDTSSAPLIFSNRLFHQILDEYEGGKIRMIIDQDTISNYLVKGMGSEFTSIATGPSITVVAADLFAKFEAKEIVFLGQDLSYVRGGNVYAEGGRDQIEKINVESADYISLTNRAGQDLFSTTGLIGARDSIELIIRNHPECLFYNGTQGGLDIEGATPICFKERVASWPLLGQFDWPEPELSPSEIKTYTEKYYSELEAMALDIVELERITARRNKAIKRFMNYRQRGMKPKKLDELLIEIDRLYVELTENKLFKMEIEPNLVFVCNAIMLQYYYEGTDRNLYYESKEKTLLGCAAQMEEYLILLKEVLWEVGGKSTLAGQNDKDDYNEN